MSHCRVQLWEQAGCLCSSRWLSSELAMVPIGVHDTSASEAKQEEAGRVAFSPQGEMGI